jgi:protein involved in polysaccharide export with SLBB domain
VTPVHRGVPFVLIPPTLKDRLNRHRMSNPRLAGLLVLLAALLTSGSGLRAQQPASVRPGDRVRVTTPELHRRIGRVIAVRADTLVFQARGADGPVALPLPRVSRLEVARGRHSPFRGALIGTGVGAVAGYGAALAMVAGQDACDSSDCLTGRDIAALFVWAGATAAGAVGGALIAADTERWVSVPLASLAPAGAVTLPAGVPGGALVRVRGPAAARPVVGRVVGVRGDSLVLLRSGSRGETVVALAEVRTLEIGAGRARTASTLRGAAVGAVVGAAAVGALAYRNAQRDEFLVENDEVGRTVLWAAGLGGAPLGAVAGGLVGYGIGTERWVLLPPLAGVTVAPGPRGGLALGLTLPAR